MLNFSFFVFYVHDYTGLFDYVVVIMKFSDWEFGGWDFLMGGFRCILI